MLYQLSYLGGAAGKGNIRAWPHLCEERAEPAQATYNPEMARVMHIRLYGARPADQEAVQAGVLKVRDGRTWRGDPPWLADRFTSDLFGMEYFRHASEAAFRERGEELSAAGFVRLRGDECDALAVLFACRDLSERFGLRATLRDPDNPIAKLRLVDLVSGRLPDHAPLEAILVARPIYKRLPGAVVEMYPPRALGSAFGTVDGRDQQRRDWAFLVHGMRGSAAGFFEAEAEAMRIYRGVRHLS
ncbi:MAG: hypothetical protein NVS3B18_01430 [Candidatus Dormibacteria bacterium]